MKADVVCLSETIFLLVAFVYKSLFSVEGLRMLSLLNLEGCPVTAACLDSLSGWHCPHVLGYFWSHSYL